MYKLFCSRNSYAMTAQVMLEELSLPYELAWTKIHIPMADKEQALITANPNGRVPTLITPEGPLYESAAILVHLAENHPEAGLMPALDDPRRRLYWQWHFFLGTTFQPDEMIQSDASVFLPGDPTGQDALKAESMNRLRHAWGVLNDAVGEGPYLLGDIYTTCDISFAMQACWHECQPPEGLAAYPDARRCLQTILDRPACRAVLKVHDVEFQAEVRA